jgi:hypothetical protein
MSLVWRCYFGPQGYQQASADISGVSIARRTFVRVSLGTVSVEIGGRSPMLLICAPNSLTQSISSFGLPSSTVPFHHFSTAAVTSLVKVCKICRRNSPLLVFVLPSLPSSPSSVRRQKQDPQALPNGSPTFPERWKWISRYFVAFLSSRLSSAKSVYSPRARGREPHGPEPCSTFFLNSIRSWNGPQASLAEREQLPTDFSTFTSIRTASLISS